MNKSKERYSVEWDCPKCGNSHNWWWDDMWEAYSEDISDMLCDKCGAVTKCQGDGHGFYTPVEKTEPDDDMAAQIKTLFDAVNTISKRLASLESMKQADSKAAKKGPGTTFLDLIHGTPSPFHERLREGCQLGDMSNETVAKILRFVAVEVERMTERDMGGSFTVSNLEVARQLRSFAETADIPF